MMRSIAFLALVAVGVLNAAELEFDAASIKPNSFTGGSRGEAPGRGYLRFAPGRVTSGSNTGVTVRRIILDARAADTSADESQLRVMLQTLLAQRFSLTVRHGGTAPSPVYALVVGKNGIGPALQEMKDGVDRLNALEMSGQKTVDRPAIDRTGLQGLYYWLVSWDEGEDFMTMTQEGLGLKFEAEKAVMDAVVIEHVEPPSEN